MRHPCSNMGRARILWSATRPIDVTMTAVTLQYRIPLCDDRKYLGELKDCTIKDGYIILNYSATPEAKGYTEPAITIQQVETEISFQ